MFYHFVLHSGAVSSELGLAVHYIISPPTCTHTDPSSPPHDKKAVREFAYLALITRSVSSVINELGEVQRGREGGRGGVVGEAIDLTLLCF